MAAEALQKEPWQRWQRKGETALGLKRKPFLVRVQSKKSGQLVEEDIDEDAPLNLSDEDAVWQELTPAERVCESLDQEVWRWVPSLVLTQVSNKCRVRRWTEDGYRLPRPKKNPDTGYIFFTVKRVNDGWGHEYLHRMVAMAFKGMPAKGFVARHLVDPNPERCEPENIGFGTYADNARDRFLHAMQGLNASNGKERRRMYGWLDDERAREIYVADGSLRELSEKFGLAPTTISKIRTRSIYAEATAGLERGAFGDIWETRRKRAAK
jgi:hypothetical protein